MENVIAANLKRIRQLKGWTQDQVAKSLGITKGAVSNHENNQRVLNVFDIEKYANLYGVLPGTLFDVNFNEDNVSRFSLIHLLNEVQAGMFTDINEINCMETDMVDYARVVEERDLFKHKFAEKNNAVTQLTAENERLKKENLELIGTVESLKKVVKSVWTHLSDYYRELCESLGIRQSRGYHR